MINLYEYRIGNYLQLSDSNDIVEIVSLSLKDKHKIKWKLLDKNNNIAYNPNIILKPITITEEILNNLNFHRDDDNGFIDATFELWLYNMSKNSYDWWIYSYCEVDGKKSFIKKIKYVHELQNIYFIINEEELLF